MKPIVYTKACVPASEEVDLIETTIGDLLRKQATAYNNAEAMVEVRSDGEIGRTWTYAELASDSEAIARGLAKKYAPGERIVIWAQNSPEWVLMEYAAAMAGLILVTANPSFRAQELRYVLEQSGAVALIHGDMARETDLAPIALDATNGLTAVQDTIRLIDACSIRSEEGSLPSIKPRDAAQIQYTSGTTGFPKGAVLHHLGLINNARFGAHRTGLNAQSTYLCILPMFHTAGCGVVTLGSLQAGARMVLMENFDAELAGQLIEMQEVTHIVGVPIMILGLLDSYKSKNFDPSSLDTIVCGGSMVAPALATDVTELFGCSITVIYGQTEICPAITHHGKDDRLEDVCNNVGRAVAQTEVSVRRVSDNSVANIDEVGEICARGPCVMLNYHDNPTATAEAIDKDNWLHTGDLGSMDSRGYFSVKGRLKDMIIRGGENLFPAEIENTLLDHPSVNNVAVVGLPDERWGEIVAAFILPTNGMTCDPNILKAYCREHLSPQKTPTIWKLVESFPLIGPGKIQKFKLVETEAEYPHLTA